jgi:hypothetical protein
MKYKVYVRSFYDKMPDCEYKLVNTTSNSRVEVERTLSPFFLGPVFPGKCLSENMENAWQYSKVYKHHLNEDGTIKDEYFEWRNKGFAQKWATRYPMGKNRSPEFTLLNDDRLGYIEARKALYIPLYNQSVIYAEGFHYCREILQSTNLVLHDYDGYDHEKLNMTMEDVVNNKYRRMGHAFVLKMLLDLNET